MAQPVPIMRSVGKKKRMLRAVDLFAGCGGLTAGLTRAGFAVQMAVEIDKHAVASYRLNHPDVPLFEKDVREVDFVNELAALGIAPGELDLLAACPPCQGFSTIRTLNNAKKIRDGRNDLVDFVGDVVDAVRPRALLFENVPGLARESRFKELLKRLALLQYKCVWAVVDASRFGVPQRRKRLIMLASLMGQIALPKARKHAPTVRDAIGGLARAGQSGDWLHDMKERRTKRILRLLSYIPKNGGSRSALPKSMILECHKRVDGFKDVYGRLRWDRPSSTITSGCTNPSKGRFVHPVEDRALTAREAALLQGFPKKYRFARSTKAEISKQIGNAVPPSFAYCQARQVRLHLRQHLSR